MIMIILMRYNSRQSKVKSFIHVLYSTLTMIQFNIFKKMQRIKGINKKVMYQSHHQIIDLIKFHKNYLYFLVHILCIFIAYNILNKFNLTIINR